MFAFLKKVVSRLSLPSLKCNTTPVLGYHSVHPDHPLAVRPDDLREQIRFLKENFEVVPLAEYVRRKLAGELTEGTAAVTFDDGYEDNYLYAYPVLKEFSCPATLFLVTRFIENRKGLQFAKRVGLFGGLKPLSWEQLAVMSDLVDVGAHTHSHVQASRVPFSALVRELKVNVEMVKSNLGVTPTLFSYPWGQPRDILPVGNKLIRRLFKGAVTTVFSADNRSRAVNPFQLRRVIIGPGDDLDIFVGKVCGAFEFLRPAAAVRGFFGSNKMRNDSVYLRPRVQG